MKLTYTIFFAVLSLTFLSCTDGSTKSPNTNSTTKPEGELIPRSSQESAKYYLISVEADGEFLRSTHSRVSSMSHGYSITRIDCKAKRYQDLGYGENKQSNIKIYKKTQWANLVNGSSKYDLVSFVCSRNNQ
ncbi:hypothetical protein [Kangiella marina]|uniref:Lipoprotein n=1 Tax=Kangiella marina TaxID=1079178 RepID=A0ABP8ING2_9GAMM